MAERINIASGTPWEQKYGYSRAVRLGQLVEVAGTTASDESGQVIAAGDPYRQTRFILDKIEAALQQAGAQLADVIRTRMFLTDMAMIDQIGRAHGEVFKDVRPAATAVEVQALIDPRMLIEIEVTAWLQKP